MRTTLKLQLEYIPNSIVIDSNEGGVFAFTVRRLASNDASGNWAISSKNKILLDEVRTCLNSLGRVVLRLEDSAGSLVDYVYYDPDSLELFETKQDTFWLLRPDKIRSENIYHV